MDTKEFESSFQFIGSHINSFSQSNDFLSITSDMDLIRAVDVEYSVSDVQEADDSDLFGVLTLFIKVNVKEKGGKRSNKKYKGNLRITGFFKSDKELGVQNFAKMLEINGCASLFSIARSFFISISAQSMLDGQITLPLLNIVNMSKRKSEIEKEKTGSTQ